MLLDLAFLATLGLIAGGLGLRGLRLLGETPEHPADAWGLALPLGLGAIALGVLGLGEVGWLGLPGIVAMLLGAAAIGLPGAVRSLRVTVAGLRGAAFHPGWDGPLVVVLMGTLLTALAPPTDGDALCYHLQVPKVFLAAGSVTFDPDLHETAYPLATEALYAVALAIRGPVACRLVQWLLGVSLALAVAGLARPALGDRARWGATIALLAPAVSNGMGAPLNDVALAAFGNAAILGWTRWAALPGPRRAAIAGVLAGMAIGVKYPALVLAGLIGLAMLGRAIRERSRARIIEAILFGLAAFAAGGAWYLRAYLMTGNPVYPFFRGVFGGAGLDEVLDPIKRPLAVTPWNLLTALGPMTIDPARFDSVSHQIGPLFLLGLPCLFLIRTPKGVRNVVLLGWTFLTLCLTQRQSPRFLLLAFGPMAVGVAWVASTWWDRRARALSARILSLLVVGLLVGEAAIAAGRARHGIGVVIGRESRGSYLDRREPTYRVGRWIDANLPESARIVGQEHRGFYLPRPYTMELAHRRRTGLAARGESPEAIVATLRARGFTHLLLCPPDPIDAVEFDPTLSRALSPWLSGREPLYCETIVDPDGVPRRYAIHALDDRPASTSLAGVTR